MTDNIWRIRINGGVCILDFPMPQIPNAAELEAFYRWLARNIPEQNGSDHTELYRLPPFP